MAAEGKHPLSHTLIPAAAQKPLQIQGLLRDLQQGEARQTRHRWLHAEHMRSAQQALHRHAARHLNHRAIDVAGLVAGQKRVDVGDLFGLAQAAQRHAVLHFGNHLVGNGRQDGRGNEARRHRIHAHALGAEFAAPGLGEADHAELAGGVVGLAEVAVDADHRAGVENHAAALRHHGVGHGLGAMEHAAQVDVDHAVELLQRHLLQPRILGDASVVHQHVDAAKAFHHLATTASTISRWVTSITKPSGLGAQRLALLHGFVHHGLLHVADDDGGAFRGELECSGQANALSGAGDERDFSFETFHGVGAKEVTKGTANETPK